jgi:hypothetical protein
MHIGKAPKTLRALPSSICTLSARPSSVGRLACRACPTWLADGRTTCGWTGNGQISLDEVGGGYQGRRRITGRCERECRVKKLSKLQDPSKPAETRPNCLKKHEDSQSFRRQKEWSHQESNPRPQPRLNRSDSMLRLRATNCAITP